MNVKRRSTFTASLVCFALLIATATVGAATINGTAGNDTLRGGRGGGQARRARPATTSSSAAAAMTCSSEEAATTSSSGGQVQTSSPAAPVRTRQEAMLRTRSRADCEIVTGVPAAPPPPPSVRRRRRHPRRGQPGTSGDTGARPAALVTRSCPTRPESPSSSRTRHSSTVLEPVQFGFRLERSA